MLPHSCTPPPCRADFSARHRPPLPVFPRVIYVLNGEKHFSLFNADTKLQERLEGFLTCGREEEPRLEADGNQAGKRRGTRGRIMKIKGHQG